MMKVVMKMPVAEIKICDLEGNGNIGLTIYIIQVFSCFQRHQRIY